MKIIIFSTLLLGSEFQILGSRSFKIVSKIWLNGERIDISRPLRNSVFEQFLCVGVTLAIFKILGKCPHKQRSC